MLPFPLADQTSFWPFSSVHKNLINTTCDIKVDAGVVHIPEISKGKVSRPFEAGEMTMEAGRPDRVKAEENVVKGKFLHTVLQGPLKWFKIHDLLFPGNAFASHVDGSNLFILGNIILF